VTQQLRQSSARLSSEQISCADYAGLTENLVRDLRALAGKPKLRQARSRRVVFRGGEGGLLDLN
jgi:hypothetical protein